MTNLQKGIAFVIAGAVIGLVASVVIRDSTLSGVYNNASSIGPSGTLTASDIWTGTGSLIASTFTVAASSTIPVDVAVSGVLSTDTFVQVSLASVSANGLGWSVCGASASSTNNYVTMRLCNFTGASAVVPSTIASSTVKVFVRH